MLLDFSTFRIYNERPAARLVLHALSSVSYLDQTDMEPEGFTQGVSTVGVIERK